MTLKHIISTARLVTFVVILYALTASVFFLTYVTTFSPTEKFQTVRLVVLLVFAPIILKYVFHLFIAPTYPIVQFLRSRRNDPHFRPSVSVLIPAWNEEVGILKTIVSVLDTKYENLEIIVVNDGSTDKTGEMVKTFIQKYQTTHKGARTPIHYIELTNGGKAKALNVGLASAKGEIIITIDADSVMDKDAIHNFIPGFQDPRVASVAGNVAIGNKTKPIGILQQLEYVYGFYFKRADSVMNAVYIVGGAAASYRKDIITAIGGFDESIITEDIELSTRLQDVGYKVRYAAHAIIYTEGPSDFRALCQQRLRWKYGRLITFNKYRHLFFSLSKHHNKYLSFLILPIALFAEILLFFEGLLLTVFYTYTFYTKDFMPLLFVIALLTFVILMQILSDPKKRYHSNLIFIAPGAWILFYVMDIVEYIALLGSLKKLLIGEEIKWQKWNREGLEVKTKITAPTSETPVHGVSI